MEYFQIIDFEQLQNYKTRTPPWIKLQNSLLDTYYFTHLPEPTRYHVVAIMLLASRYQNVIPYDNEWIKQRIFADSDIDLPYLEKIRFIKKLPSTDNNNELNQGDASHAIILQAKCKQNACLEREREREEKKNIVVKSEPLPKSKTSCPYEKIVELYHKILPNCPRVTKLSANRKSLMKARWNEELSTLERWEKFFIYITRSDFLMGKVDPPPGRQRFSGGLFWFIKQENYLKISEKNYHERKN